PELIAKAPETTAEASVAATGVVDGDQASQAAPVAEPQVAPASIRPSSVPTSPQSAPKPAAPRPTPAAAQTVPSPKPETPLPAPAKPYLPTSQPTQAAVASQEKPRQVGEVVYTEGKVSVHRAGKTITALDIGDVVHAYDVVMTGPASLAQVDLGSGRPGGAFIRLSENTAFYFDTKELSVEQRRTVLQLLSGSIAVKVEKLAGGSFSAVSDTAVLGVRGTEFVIDTIPDGSILVSCVEGAVAIQGPEGQTATAQPGKAVTGREAGLVTATVTVSELARFRSSWRQDSFASFADQAVRYSSGYATTLDTKRGAFDAALASLRSQEATLSLWREAKASGKAPRFSEWTTEKKALGGVLFESLKALFIMERPYYRLLELKSLHGRGTGVGTLQDDRSTTDFFNQFDARYGSLADGMANVREALLLFAWASAGSPLGDFFGAKAESLGSGALFLNGDNW
ncbi:MAG: hypothetical protein A3J97_09335, partial [Spirochaetes bacterium RIFOXYC1_FULL_54_7]